MSVALPLCTELLQTAIRHGSSAALKQISFVYSDPAKLKVLQNLLIKGSN